MRGREGSRAGSDPTDETIPLVELQYRGRRHQPNGRDWTVEAALRANDLDVSQDARTREAMLRALPLLSEVELDALRMGR
ncbi:MAG: BREX-1 system phosphatase PglZ type B, partial [Gemmatimonadetes bacterium]|nr:BREX-1 system phosphatase PglZ type B [Gemmatimonadota bacterium]